MVLDQTINKGINMTDIKQRHAEITRRFLVGKTLSDLGRQIDRTRQEVYMWKSGKQSPPAVMLLKIIQLSAADDWVIDWAEECLRCYLEE